MEGAILMTRLSISRFALIIILGPLAWFDASSASRAFSNHGPLSIGCLVDALDRFIEEPVELGIGLLGRQPFYERPRKARHDAVIPAHAVVGFLPRIAARQRN